jgi:hypothetical protein
MKKQYWFHYVTNTGWLAAIIFPPILIWFWWKMRDKNHNDFEPL